MNYAAFRKNFYIEVPEIAKMTDEQVKLYRSVSFFSPACYWLAIAASLFQAHAFPIHVVLTVSLHTNAATFLCY